jgi:putative phosphoesterase
MIRIALISDTHGQLDPRVAELVRGCDLAVHGGDIGNADILRRLQPRSGQVHAVRGNNDLPSKWPETDHAILAQLPEQLGLTLPGGQLVLIHGHQSAASDRHQRLRRQFPNARAILYGHSHRLVADQDALPWVLNPGAAGRARTYGGPSCMILTASDRHWELESHRFQPVDQERRRSRPHRSEPVSAKTTTGARRKPSNKDDRTTVRRIAQKTL